MGINPTKKNSKFHHKQNIGLLLVPLAHLASPKLQAEILPFYLGVSLIVTLSLCLIY